jgi:xanthine dehydrogenase accessory factor
MEFWNTIKEELEADHNVVLMIVLHSDGSSPGRQGFKMLVSTSGLLSGSIGGGIMEHKLVELCKSELLINEFSPFIKRQIHQSNIEKDKSGMICSGEQTIAFYRLKKADISTATELINTKSGVLVASEKGIHFASNATLSKAFELDIQPSDQWSFRQDFGHFPTLHVVGGGHVGLALSKFGFELGFSVKLYDDRTGLNTVEQNQYAQFIFVSDYQKIDKYISSTANDYVVLMSFGYRTDKVILQHLLPHQFQYLGMMGSKEKVKKLLEELLAEGVPQAELDTVYSPIGIQISSKTPEEIAISILAEIIQVKNNAK